MDSSSQDLLRQLATSMEAQLFVQVNADGSSAIAIDLGGSETPMDSLAVEMSASHSVEDGAAAMLSAIWSVIEGQPKEQEVLIASSCDDCDSSILWEGEIQPGVSVLCPACANSSESSRFESARRALAVDLAKIAQSLNRNGTEGQQVAVAEIRRVAKSLASNRDRDIKNARKVEESK
ncbi:MAG: hypothetical protein WCH97_05015 [Actinomycetes bacterium]